MKEKSKKNERTTIRSIKRKLTTFLGKDYYRIKKKEGRNECNKNRHR